MFPLKFCNSTDRFTFVKKNDVGTPHTKDSKKRFELNSVLTRLENRLQEEVLNPLEITAGLQKIDEWMNK